MSVEPFFYSNGKKLKYIEKTASTIPHLWAFSI
jgi:hypothetical protein